MLELAKNQNYDLVFGSRYEKNSNSEDDTVITYVGNKIFSFIGKFFFHYLLQIFYIHTFLAKLKGQ